MRTIKRFLVCMGAAAVLLLPLPAAAQFTAAQFPNLAEYLGCMTTVDSYTTSSEFTGEEKADEGLPRIVGYGSELFDIGFEDFRQLVMASAGGDVTIDAPGLSTFDDGSGQTQVIAIKFDRPLDGIAGIFEAGMAVYGDPGGVPLAHAELTAASTTGATRTIAIAAAGGAVAGVPYGIPNAAGTMDLFQSGFIVARVKTAGGGEIVVFAGPRVAEWAAYVSGVTGTSPVFADVTGWRSPLQPSPTNPLPVEQAVDQATAAAEDPPAETPPSDDPPAEDPPAEDPPVENPAAETPPPEDPPGEEPPGGELGDGGESEEAVGAQNDPVGAAAPVIEAPDDGEDDGFPWEYVVVPLVVAGAVVAWFVYRRRAQPTGPQWEEVWSPGPDDEKALELVEEMAAAVGPRGRMPNGRIPIERSDIAWPSGRGYGQSHHEPDDDPYRSVRRLDHALGGAGLTLRPDDYEFDPETKKFYRRETVIPEDHRPIGLEEDVVIS